MIKEIIADRAALSVPCVEVADGDLSGEICQDIIDTATYHQMSGENGCAGLAANQIGYDKRIIAVVINKTFVPMINPVITKKWGGMKSENEGCLSFPGKRTKIARYKRIRVSFNDYRDGKRIEFNFKGFTARAIQHELDHLEGKLI